MALDTSKWSISCPGQFSPTYSLDSRLRGLQACMDPCICQKLKPSHPVCSLVTILTKLSGFFLLYLTEIQNLNCNLHSLSPAALYQTEVIHQEKEMTHRILQGPLQSLKQNLKLFS